MDGKLSFTSAPEGLEGSSYFTKDDRNNTLCIVLRVEVDVEPQQCCQQSHKGRCQACCHIRTLYERQIEGCPEDRNSWQSHLAGYTLLDRNGLGLGGTSIVNDT